MFVLARHKRRMEALFKEGRYSTATRVLEQAHQSIQVPVGLETMPLSTVEEAKSILVALNPIASPDDLLPAPSAEEGSDPFTFSSEDVQRCIRDLSKGSANGARDLTMNGASERMVLQCDPPVVCASIGASRHAPQRTDNALQQPC